MADLSYVTNYVGRDFRRRPYEYMVGKGEQGVLMAEPYKSEIGQYWRFKTIAEATKSSRIIYRMFLEYLEESDFVGADMARKYLMMGWTRARRYANHASGRKYKPGTREILPIEPDCLTSEKAIAAAIFKVKYDKAKKNTRYLKMMMHHKLMTGEGRKP